MDFIRPITITEGMITACNVPETDYDAWVGGTTYTATTSWVVHNHKIYQCLITHTTAAEPDLNCAPIVTVNPKWLDAGYDNRWKMFDNVVGSQTQLAESITVSLVPGSFDSFAMLDAEGTDLYLTMTDPVEGEVYSEHIDLVNKTYTADPNSYFYAPIIMTNTVILSGIGRYPNATLAVEFANAGGTAKIGTLVVGTKKYAGSTQLNPTIGIVDHSIKTTDDFGNFTILARVNRKRMTCEVWLDNGRLDDLYKTLASYRVTPLVWIAAGANFASMIIYGFYKDFRFTRTPSPNVSTCTYEIEGLS